MKYPLVTITVFSILIIAGSGQSSVLVVDPEGGGDYLNIEAAVLEAVDGDIIEFVDGTHYINSPELIITVPNLTFRSAGEDPNSCNILGADDNCWLSFGEFGSDYNCEIYNLGLSSFSSLSLFFEDTLIHGCRISSCGMISANTMNRAVIENTIFEDNGDILFYIDEISIRSCQFHNSGIGAGDYSFRADSVLLEECSFSGSGGAAIHSVTTLVDRCTFSELETDPLFMRTLDSATIDSSLFSDNQVSYSSVLVMGATNVLDCTFRNNTSTGVTAGLCVGGFPGSANVFCENVDFVDNSSPNGAPDAFVDVYSELNLNCCEIDEANIGGPGEVTISYDGCSVSTEHSSLGGVKAIFR